MFYKPYIFDKTNLLVIQPAISDDYANEYNVEQSNIAKVTISTDVTSTNGWYCPLNRDNDIKIVSRTGYTFYVYKSLHMNDGVSEELYEILDESYDPVNSSEIITSSSAYAEYDAFRANDSAIVFGEPLHFGSVGSNGSTLATGNICFLGHELVNTDQGKVRFDELTTNYTINNSKITRILSVVNVEDYLVLIEKDILAKGIPEKDTFVSSRHGIYIDNNLIKRHHLIINDKCNTYKKVTGKNVVLAKNLTKIKGITKVHRSNEIVYNIMCEKHEVMVINGLICETLSPNVIIIH